MQLDAGNRGVFSTVANGYAEHSPLGTLLASQQITSGEHFTLWAVLLVEAVAAAALVAVYLVSTKATSPVQRAPFVVGLAFAALLLVTTPLTNGSVNPARATAVAIFAESWSLKQLWLFWVAPLVGAAIAAVLHRVFSSPALTGFDETDEPYLDDDEADDTPDADDVTGTSDEPTGPTALS
jgi:aquaporin Z